MAAKAGQRSRGSIAGAAEPRQRNWGGGAGDCGAGTMQQGRQSGTSSAVAVDPRQRIHGAAEEETVEPGMVEAGRLRWGGGGETADLALPWRLR